MPTPKRPWVLVAAAFDRVIEEKDGSLTLVRLADRIQVDFQDDGTIPHGSVAFPVSFTVVVALRAEEPTDCTLKMRAVLPDGTVRHEMTYAKMSLPGGGRGHNLIVNATIGVATSGMLWMEIYSDDFGELARIPIEIAIARTPRA